MVEHAAVNRRVAGSSPASGAIYFQGLCLVMSDSSEPANTSKLAKLIARYEEFHQHSTNKLIHYICVPAIAFSLIGLLWCIKIADIAIPTTEYFLTLNVGVVFICLAGIKKEY